MMPDLELSVSDVADDRRSRPLTVFETPSRSILDLLLSFAKKPIQVREDPARFRPVDVPLLEANTSRLRAHTSWQPTVPFELALQRTLDYWRATLSPANTTKRM